MPLIKDTELRVLLLVARQTVGRSNQMGQKREADWLAHSQIKTRTGRASEAISTAIDTLVQKGLLEVLTPDGTLLMRPEERRACRGTLLYRITPQAFHIPLTDFHRKNEMYFGKPKTTETIQQPNYRSFRKPKRSQDGKKSSEDVSPKTSPDRPSERPNSPNTRMEREETKQLIRERLKQINSVPTTGRRRNTP
jgi:hypothetical protein